MSVLSSGNGVDHTKEVTLRRARLVLRWVTVHGFRYLTSHSSQLNLLPSAGREISIPASGP